MIAAQVSTRGFCTRSVSTSASFERVMAFQGTRDFPCRGLCLRSGAGGRGSSS